MPRLPAYVLTESSYHGHAVAAVLGPKGSLGIDAPLLPTEAEAWKRRIQEKGTPLTIVLQMDASPDRSFAATHLDALSDGVPPTLLAHQHTCDILKTLQDTFKNSPMTPVLEVAALGLDPLSMRWPRPAMGFSRSMTLEWPPITVQILHAPSVMPGASWVHLPKEKILFVGDAVSTTLPPLLHEARFDDWLETLAVLRRAPFKNCRVFCSHGGWVDSKAIARFATFLRAARRRAESLRATNDPQKDLPAAAASLLDYFSFPADRRDFMQRRLQAGLHVLWERERTPAPEKNSAG